jgi:hypothetical protein
MGRSPIHCLALWAFVPSLLPLPVNAQRSAAPVITTRKSLVGTWKLNLAKSVWGNIPAPREDTLLVTQDDGVGLKWTASGVSANGERFSFSFEGATDGKDYPMKSPNNNEAVIGFTRAYRKVGARLEAATRRTAPSSRQVQPQFQTMDEP